MNQRKEFQKIIQALAKQSGEDKLRIAFDLSLFVHKLWEAGDRYADKTKKYRTRKTS